MQQMYKLSLDDAKTYTISRNDATLRIQTEMNELLQHIRRQEQIEPQVFISSSSFICTSENLHSRYTDDTIFSNNLKNHLILDMLAYLNRIKTLNRYR